MRYNNYHKHTHYSNIRTLDCISKPEDYIKRAVELGHTTYFTTEHGYQGNVFEAQTLCEKYGLKCIYGVEAYYVDDMLDKSSRTMFHIMLVALTERARKEINRIMSVANQDGFYYKPRIDLKSLLSLTPTDTVVTTACIAGRLFKGEDWESAFLLPVMNHFGDNFFLEVQSHAAQQQALHNMRILQLKNRYNLQLIHANDSHYIYPHDAKFRDLFLRAKGIYYDEESGFELDYPDAETILERYSRQGVLTREQAMEALNNTLIFDRAEGIHVDKEFKIPQVKEEFLRKDLHLPNFDYANDDLVLQAILKRSWGKEKGRVRAKRIPEYEQAIYYETDIVRKCGMARYFILDHLIVKRAVNEYSAVLTRSGRGSAVSFYINKLLGLTEIDRLAAPITLYPTRFMSAERILQSKSLPDIDLNWASVEPVIQASKDILGEEGVYYMVAYKPLQESSAFRLWCKANGYDLEEYDEIAKNLEDHLEDKRWQQIIEDSKVFRGVIESIAPSPCSFLLLDRPIPDEVGLIRVGNATNYVMCCALDGYNCDVYKYLKNDYLVVRVWDIIDRVYQLIGRPIDDIETLLSKCDDKVWDIYANALTTTINQSDSDFGKQTLKRYKPRSLAEMSAWVASIRPGFASLLNTFLDREPYSTGVKQLDELLEDSFHFMMYQESIMKYLVWLGLEEKNTYDIIKKISKKKFKEEELHSLQKQLESGWIKNVGSMDGFAETWQVVQDAARYSFNACVSGDTIIQRAGQNNNCFEPTVEEMYRIRNDAEYAKSTGHMSLHKKYTRYGYGNALSMFKDHRIRKNRIIDIRFNGIKKIYRVKMASGAYLDCTTNHKFPTPNGKKKLEDLKVGDTLFIKGKYEKHPDNYRFTDGEFKSNLPKKGQRGFQCNPDGNSTKFNSIVNQKKSQKCSCESCGKPYDGSKFELHHIDMDRTNNEPSNLKWLCNSCHKRIHYSHGRQKVFEKGIPVLEDKIISIEYLRTDKTYDIEMAHPAHTFISKSGLITSNSHSLSVATDSLYGAYLKSHYPLEYYTVVLTLYADDMARTANLIAELPYFGIKLKPIKFGKSGADYTMDQASNSIYKGVSSIKYCNGEIADELLALSENHYDSFFDLLADIESKTSVNSRQLTILTGLNFFSDFGCNKYLLQVIDIYNEFAKAKIISKKKMPDLEEKFGLSDAILKQCSGKETPAQYRDLNNAALIKALTKSLENEPMSVIEHVKFEMEYLEYTTYCDPKIDESYYVVVGFKTYSDPSRPAVILRQIKTGNEIKTRIKQGKVYRQNPFGEFAFLKVDSFTEVPKIKLVNGDWVKTDETEQVLEYYEVVKNQVKSDVKISSSRKTKVGEGG